MYKHQVGGFIIPLDAMKKFVEKEIGPKNVQMLQAEQLMQKAVVAGLNRGVVALLDSVDGPR
jgi:hypothetical protein